MVTRRNVLCGAESEPRELEVNVDTVYKRYNIHGYVDAEGREGYEYDEDEMTLIEYFRDALPENQMLNEEALGEISVLLGMYQQQVDQTIAELSMIVEEALNRDV